MRRLTDGFCNRAASHLGIKMDNRPQTEKAEEKGSNLFQSAASKESKTVINETQTEKDKTKTERFALSARHHEWVLDNRCKLSTFKPDLSLLPPPIHRKCEWCGAELTAERITKRFCNKGCRDAIRNSNRKAQLAARHLAYQNAKIAFDFRDYGLIDQTGNTRGVPRSSKFSPRLQDFPLAGEGRGN
jgi:hypothetical protein